MSLEETDAFEGCPRSTKQKTIVNIVLAPPIGHFYFVFLQQKLTAPELAMHTTQTTSQCNKFDMFYEFLKFIRTFWPEKQ